MKISSKTTMRAIFIFRNRMESKCDLLSVDTVKTLLLQIVDLT